MPTTLQTMQMMMVPTANGGNRIHGELNIYNTQPILDNAQPIVEEQEIYEHNEDEEEQLLDSNDYDSRINAGVDDDDSSENTGVAEARTRGQ